MSRFVLLLLCTLVLGSCVPANENLVDTDSSQPSQSSQQSQSSQSSEESSAESDTVSLPVYVPGSIILEDLDIDDAEYRYPYERSYRLCYYQMGVHTGELFGAKELTKWHYDVWAVKYPFGTEPKEMMLKEAVLYFNIPREDFERAVEKSHQQSPNYSLYERWEIPNTDIIYTFDDEIINEYYRYR